MSDEAGEVLTAQDHIDNLRRIIGEPYPDWEDLKTIADAVLALYREAGTLQGISEARLVRQRTGGKNRG